MRNSCGLVVFWFACRQFPPQTIVLSINYLCILDNTWQKLKGEKIWPCGFIVCLSTADGRYSEQLGSCDGRPGSREAKTSLSPFLYSLVPPAHIQGWSFLLCSSSRTSSLRHTQGCSSALGDSKSSQVGHEGQPSQLDSGSQGSPEKQN